MKYVYLLRQALVYLIVIFWIYEFAVSLCALIKFKEKPLLKNKKHKFMAIIPAHNEEKVIVNLIESLKNQNYDKNLYDIYVIADNCTDNTAKYAKEVGATVIVLVGEKECPLTEYADYVFENRTASNDDLVEEIYIQYFALGARFMKNNGEFPEYEKFIDALKQMPEVLQKVREDNDERALAFAEKHKDTKFHMCVGAGNTWGETYCFAMCVLEEMQWIATKSIHAAEFFHGTVEMTEKDMSFMLFKGEDETRPLLDRVEKFVRKYSDVVQVWDTKDYELKGVDPSVRGLVSPLVMAAQLERVSAHFEHVRNHSLEIRRYYRTVKY